MPAAWWRSSPAWRSTCPLRRCGPRSVLFIAMFGSMMMWTSAPVKIHFLRDPGVYGEKTTSSTSTGGARRLVAVCLVCDAGGQRLWPESVQQMMNTAINSPLENAMLPPIHHGGLLLVFR